MNSVYSVGQINNYIRRMIQQDILLSRVYVRGEVSNLKYHTSGHIYFSLKDETGTLSCVMFAGNRKGLTFAMKNGDKVICAGNFDVYTRGGNYQMYVKAIRLEGAGILYERYLKLKAELEEMGMFDAAYKKPVPRYARRVGIVTAPTGAAIRDIQNISARRNPYIELILYPALVQGEGAAETIARGIEKLDDAGVDVIIVGRGGGSIEDLWAFNEEIVARAIFNCRTPVISAVGHETDTTIADFVADLRAPTPSAAAELAVFDYSEFADTIERYRRRLWQGTERHIIKARGDVRYYEVRLDALSPKKRLNDRRRQLAEKEEKMAGILTRQIAGNRMRAEDISRRMSLTAERTLRQRQKKYSMLVERMRGLNPLDRLKAGFSFVSDEEGRAVTRVRAASVGQVLRIHVTDGIIKAGVQEIESRNIPEESYGRGEERTDNRGELC